MTRSLRALLERLVDYAGLFPPAALSMQDAVRNYARYSDGEHAWALGKFIVPEARVKEVPAEFPLSVLWTGGSLKRGESLEARANSVQEVEDLSAKAEGRVVYVEIVQTALIASIARAGLRAKIRTGGLTGEAFPAVRNVAEFLRTTRAAGVAFKATAGLHHPLRCVKPLTYEPNAPTGMMHGFVNVFLAAAMLEHAEGILAEADAAAFAFTDQGASWRDHFVSTEALVAMRRDFAISFGSCSFEEPIADLRELGWL